MQHKKGFYVLVLKSIPLYSMTVDGNTTENHKRMIHKYTDIEEKYSLKKK